MTQKEVDQLYDRVVEIWGENLCRNNGYVLNGLDDIQEIRDLLKPHTSYRESSRGESPFTSFRNKILDTLTPEGYKQHIVKKKE